MNYAAIFVSVAVALGMELRMPNRRHRWRVPAKCRRAFRHSRT